MSTLTSSLYSTTSSATSSSSSAVDGVVGLNRSSSSLLYRLRSAVPTYRRRRHSELPRRPSTPPKSDSARRRRSSATGGSFSSRFAGVVERSSLNGNVDNPSPQHIRFFDINIGDSRVLQIAHSLRGNQEVKTLNLSYNAFGHEGAFALSVALQENTVLERVTLCGNPNMGLSGICSLANALPHCQLQALNLSRNEIGNAGCKALAQALSQPSSQIRELLLHNNRIGNEGAVHLALALSHNTQLRNLDVSNNAIGDEGLVCMAQTGLRTNTSLRHWFVGDNCFGTAGLKALFELLQVSNATLVMLDAHLRHTPNPEQYELLQLMAYYLNLNQGGRRAWIRSDQPNLALMSHVLAVPALSMQVEVLHGLLRDLPHVWLPAATAAM